jgi:EAL domain-containing protein (putative c-di-GMP-specific phosphodiesterase class I)
LFESLEEKVQLPYESSGIPLHGEILIAYTDICAMDEEPELFLRQCEAMLQDLAKQPKRSTCVSFRLDAGTGLENLKLLGEFKESLTNGHLYLHFQPKIGIQDRTINSGESLIRWEHPEFGNIPPDRFIPSVENSTLIILLTDWAIDKALLQMVQWREDGLEIPMAVNVSIRNLIQPDFADRVMRALDRYQVEGKFLELEITESAIMQDIESSIQKLKALSMMNIDISIDDFGTGFSSLNYLRMIPAGKIKIDQSFIKNIVREEDTRRIVETAVELAHGLGKLVVAEGVEDRVTFDLLGEIGCDEAQGFFLSRPLPARQFFELYRNWKAGSFYLGK